MGSEWARFWGRVMAGELRGSGCRSMVHSVHERVLVGARDSGWAREAVEERLLALLPGLEASKRLGAEGGVWSNGVGVSCLPTAR